MARNSYRSYKSSGAQLLNNEKYLLLFCGCITFVPSLRYCSRGGLSAPSTSLSVRAYTLYMCPSLSSTHTHTRRQERSSRTVFCSPLLMVRAGRMVNHKIIYRASRHFLSALNLQLSSPAGFTFYTRPCREIQTKNKERNEICFIQSIFLIRRRSFIK
jgi:hypothetical protein